MPCWTVCLDGGPRRVNHAAIAAGHKIFSFGGYCTGEDYEVTRPIDVHVLNTVTFRWHLLPVVNGEEAKKVPYMRYGHTAVHYQDCAYIWGGRNDTNGACGILYAFNADSCSWSLPKVKGQFPSPRDGHSACVVDCKMYIYGGYEEGTNRFTEEIYALDFKMFHWNIIHYVGKPARYRDFHTASAIGNKIYVFGGRSDEGYDVFTNREIYDNEMHVFDTSSHTWSCIPNCSGDVPQGRRSHSTFEMNGCLYVFGGFNGLMNTHFNDLYKFDPVKVQWSQVRPEGKGPCARRRQCCCVIGCKVFLFGGTSPRDPIQYQSLRLDTNLDLVDHADLYVLDFSPTLKTLCMRKVIEHNLDLSLLPFDIRWELDAMTRHNTISRALTNG